VIRWEYHVENFFGMVRLGCMQILLIYSEVKRPLPKLLFGTLFFVIEMLSSRECNRRCRANRITVHVHQAGLGDRSKLPVVHFCSGGIRLL